MLKPITEKELYPVLDRMLKEPAPVLFSISSFEQWLSKLSNAIWNVDDHNVALLLEEGQKIYFSKQEHHSVLLQRSQDAYELLVEKLKVGWVWNDYNALSGNKALSVSLNKYMHGSRI